MPYAEKYTPSKRRFGPHKNVELPMPIAAFHNNEERKIGSALQSFVRRNCLEYFADDATGRVGLRCAFCAETGSDEERLANRAHIFPRQIVSVQAAVITIQYSHFPYCPEIPDNVVEHMEVLRERDMLAEDNTARGGGPKKRYSVAGVAQEMGFIDTDDGIRFVPPEGGRNERAAKRRSVASPAFSGTDYSTDDVQQQQQRMVYGSTSHKDFTEADDLKLWHGQNELGNKWKDSEFIARGVHPAVCICKKIPHF